MLTNITPVLFLVALTLTAMGGCESAPPESAVQERTSPDERSADEEEIIKEDDQNVNDNNGLEENTQGCPAPRQHRDMCAQVITWALTENGQCCEYSTPCDVPEGLQTFSSSQDCEEAIPEEN